MLHFLGEIFPRQSVFTKSFSNKCSKIEQLPPQTVFKGFKTKKTPCWMPHSYIVYYFFWQPKKLTPSAANLGQPRAVAKQTSPLTPLPILTTTAPPLDPRSHPRATRHPTTTEIGRAIQHAMTNFLPPHFRERVRAHAIFKVTRARRHFSFLRTRRG